ncbi:hypothetical protein [Mesorhizobium sp. KR2-14]|uniref:hypothetical protein n=1 Tax=Mesorhizobium sp. KR2-14 TaxID=3156610 RepID=UPI0032B484B3
MKRTIQDEDTQTIFGRVQRQVTMEIEAIADREDVARRLMTIPGRGGTRTVPSDTLRGRLEINDCGVGLPPSRRHQDELQPIPVELDGQAVGDCRAAVTITETARSAAPDQASFRDRRDILSAAYWLPMATADFRLGARSTGIFGYGSAPGFGFVCNERSTGSRAFVPAARNVRRS